MRWVDRAILKPLGPSGPPYFEGLDYRVVYADPPWAYKDKAAAGKRGAVFKYSVMTLEEIKRLPVWSLVPNAPVPSFLFLWITFPFIMEGREVMRSWGFEYKTVAFTWVKKTQDGKGYQYGMGNWSRSNQEVVLLGLRGKGHKRAPGGGSVHQVVETFGRMKHSVKPVEVSERIVRLVGDLPRIELFARTRQPGWHVWGNEVEGDVVLRDGRGFRRQGEGQAAGEGTGADVDQPHRPEGEGAEGGR